MPRFERDARKHPDSPVDPQNDLSAASGSNSDAEDSAAHIAELVRRTAEREASPRPPSAPTPQLTAPQPQGPAPAAAPDVSQRAERHDTSSVLPDAPEVGPPRRQPSRRTLAAGGVAAAVLIAGGLALSHSLGSDAGSTATATKPSATAPAGYAVKVTDVTADCARHSRGRTKRAFETQHCVKATRSLATGQVSGRPTLFVVSRIQMASVDAAASVKQVLDSTGSGNLNDLLREGKTFPGAPRKMPSSGYASVQSGPVVVVAEAGFLGAGPSSNTIPALRAAAAQVAALVTTTN